MKWFGSGNAADAYRTGREYKENGDFIRAREWLEKAYNKRVSRAVLLELLDCCLKLDEPEEAERYFDEYHKLAPNDTATLYGCRYRISLQKGEDSRKLIRILEELKAVDYSEEYAYELAKLYHKTGQTEKCIEECQEIILWFGEGILVERAKALLAYDKGEIDLEEVKAAGERFVLSQTGKQENAASESAAVPEQQELLGPSGLPEQPESVAEEKSVCQPPEEEPAYQPLEEDFLPEIDLSGIDFDTEEPVVQQRQPEPVTEYYHTRTMTEKELLRGSRLEPLFQETGVSLWEACHTFAGISAVRKQILRSVEMLQTERNGKFLVITGERRTGKTTLACDMVKLLYGLGLLGYDRLAIISAERLNGLELSERRKEIENCSLLVQGAGKLKEEMLERLIGLYAQKDSAVCLILEDHSREINQMMRGKEERNQLFHNRIHLGKYNAADLLNFAAEYLEKEDYSIEKAAAELLHGKIEQIIRTASDQERLEKTLELAAQTAARAEERNKGALLAMVEAGKIEAGDYLTIIPEDVQTLN